MYFAQKNWKRIRDNNATWEVNHSFLFVIFKAFVILTTSITSVLIQTTVPLKLAPTFATGELAFNSIDILGKLPTPTLIKYGVWTGDMAELLVPQYWNWRPQNFWGFGTPPCQKFIQRPLLSFSTMSAFGSTPLPLSADVLNEWSPRATCRTTPTDWLSAAPKNIQNQNIASMEGDRVEVRVPRARARCRHQHPLRPPGKKECTQHKSNWHKSDCR